MNSADEWIFFLCFPRSRLVCDMSFQCFAFVSEGGVSSENFPFPVMVIWALIDSDVLISALVSMWAAMLKLPTSPLKFAGGLGGRGSMVRDMGRDMGWIAWVSFLKPVRGIIMDLLCTIRDLNGPMVAVPGFIPETVVMNLPTWYFFPLMMASPLMILSSGVTNLHAVAFFFSPVGSPHCDTLMDLGI